MDRTVPVGAALLPVPHDRTMFPADSAPAPEVTFVADAQSTVGKC